VNIGEAKPKERPLAARRTFIQSSPSRSSDIPIDNETFPEDSKSELEIKDAVEIKDDGATDASVEVKETASSKLVTPNKTLEQIEKEVAENTAKYDKNILKKDDKKGSGKQEKAVVRVKKLSKKDKVLEIEPTSVMRFLRLLMIILLASYTGRLIVVYPCSILSVS
jgi:hypothetical protein